VLTIFLKEMNTFKQQGCKHRTWL